MFDIGDYEDKINNFYNIMVENSNIADIKLSEKKWTLKEMVAHLIDSASNNHQRIIRLQIDEKITFPSYEAENWKNATKIKEFDFTELIKFWKGYNFYLLHLIKNINENNLNNIWKINEKEISLKFIKKIILADIWTGIWNYTKTEQKK